jgi:small subunit ribosomal protein S6
VTETAERLYESLFLVDNARAKENAQAVLDELKDFVGKAGGTIVNCEKWEERKLAYEVEGRRRGTYCLCHWNGPPESPAKLERSCRLSELVLRVLTLRDEDGTAIPVYKDEPRKDREFDRDRDRGRDGRDRPRRRRDDDRAATRPRR